MRETYPCHCTSVVQGLAALLDIWPSGQLKKKMKRIRHNGTVRASVLPESVKLSVYNNSSILQLKMTTDHILMIQIQSQ